MLIIRKVLGVIYAPQKAFKEIAQKPEYKGPLIVMMLFILSFSGFYYAFYSRIYYDQTAPSLPEIEKDSWTENIANWVSDANITENTLDFIEGNYYGNKSIQFSLNDSAKIYMQLNIPEAIKCLGSDGYTKLSFRMKILKPPIEPTNMSIYLFSSNLNDGYFYYSLKDNILEVGIWNNKTILLTDFALFKNADWNNIKSLRIGLTWPQVKNITVLIDGVFFHGVYKSGIELYGVGILPNFAFIAFMQFTIQWVTLGICLYLISMIFGLKTAWKNMLVIVGFSLITLFIQYIILTGVIYTFPNIYLSLESLGGVSGEGLTTDFMNLQSVLSIQYDIVERLVYYVWIVALCSIALHVTFTSPWSKSISIAVISVILGVLAFRFLSYGATWL